MEPTVQVTERPATTIVSRRAMVELAGIGQLIAGALGEVYSHLGRQRVAPAGPPFVIYHGMPDNGPFEVEVCAPVPVAVEPPPGWQLGELPAGPVAGVTHVGPYDTVGQAYDALWAWLPAHGLEAAGPPRETYLSPPSTPPSQIRTAVEVPVRPASAAGAA